MREGPGAFAVYPGIFSYVFFDASRPGAFAPFYSIKFKAYRGARYHHGGVGPGLCGVLCISEQATPVPGGKIMSWTSGYRPYSTSRLLVFDRARNAFIVSASYLTHAQIAARKMVTVVDKFRPICSHFAARLFRFSTHHLSSQHIIFTMPS